MEFIKTIINTLNDFNVWSVAFRILLCIVAGGIIGSERGKYGSQAGLRTHILVGVGSAMTALTGVFLSAGLGIGGDAGRISAQVISGIGFLGAGMIIVRNNNMITGLTTAAGLWATAAIGIALGYGFYSGALIGTLVCFFTAAFLTRLERNRKRSVHIYVEVEKAHKAGDVAEALRELLHNDLALNPASPKSGTAGNVGFDVVTSKSDDPSLLRKTIEEIDGVLFAIWE
jgi:putative Mg2+ transporter-C (MgtC) family protein